MDNTPSVCCRSFGKPFMRNSGNFVARSAHAGTFRVASLNDKARDDTMENRSIIKAFFHEINKVVYGIGSDLWIRSCFDHAVVGFNGQLLSSYANEPPKIHESNFIFDAFLIII